MRRAPTVRHRSPARRTRCTRLAWIGLLPVATAAHAWTRPAAAQIAPQAAPPSEATPQQGRARESAELASTLETLRGEHGLPALAAAVVSVDGGLELAAAVGRRSVEAQTPVTVDDLWHLGSCTKAMTATLAARLVERGALRWDTTVGEVFGTAGADIDPAWSGVTLDLLLGHRSGAQANLPLGTTPPLAARHASSRAARRTAVDLALSRPPEHAPGSAFEYSNLGFMIAGAMLEARADADWEALLRREVFEPLGLASAGFGAPGSSGALDQPLGHRVVDGALRPVAVGAGDDNAAALGPAGTVHASLADWANFARAHLLGARGRGDYLAPQTWRHLHAPLDHQDYGFGWAFAERAWAAGTVLTHNGSNTMWSCVIWLAPERGVAYLAATNDGDPAVARVLDRAIQALMTLRSPDVAGSR